MSSDEARAEADLYTMYNIGGMQPVTTIGEKVHAAFLAGVEWQRTRPVTDAEVEAAARAAYENAFLKHAPEDVDRWDDLVTDNDPAAESWRQVARAALEAARKVEQ